VTVKPKPRELWPVTLAGELSMTSARLDLPTGVLAHGPHQHLKRSASAGCMCRRNSLVLADWWVELTDKLNNDVSKVWIVVFWLRPDNFDRLEVGVGRLAFSRPWGLVHHAEATQPSCTCGKRSRRSRAAASASSNLTARCLPAELHRHRQQRQ